MEILDLSKRYKEPESIVNHAPFFPKNIFAVIAGSTGCGKTNLMANLLIQKGCLDYSSVYIYSSTLHQKTYKYLKDYYGNMENKIENDYGLRIKIAHFLDSDEEIKDPKTLNPNTGHIMVFDDVMNADQSKIKEYFCRGRHNNVNVFYLCQSLHKIAKHCIRENANVFILFQQNKKTLKYFWESHISGDMGYKEFEEFCTNAWMKKHGFVVINIWEEPYCGRYVSNYDDIYVPKIHINT